MNGRERTLGIPLQIPPENPARQADVDALEGETAEHEVEDEERHVADSPPYALCVCGDARWRGVVVCGAY